MTIDLRKIIIAKLWSNYYNNEYYKNNEVKTAMRNNTATYKFADYANISYGKQHFTHYIKDGEEIEIDTKKIITQYCKDNDITIIDETKKDYKITLNPSQKAKKEFDKMLKELENSQHKNIAKVALEIRSKIK